MKPLTFEMKSLLNEVIPATNCLFVFTDPPTFGAYQYTDLINQF